MILETIGTNQEYNVMPENWDKLDDESLIWAFDDLVDWVLANEEDMSVYDNPWDVVEECKHIIADRGLENKSTHSWIFEEHDEESKVVATHVLTEKDGSTFSLTEVESPKF